MKSIILVAQDIEVASPALGLLRPSGQADDTHEREPLLEVSFKDYATTTETTSVSFRIHRIYDLRGVYSAIFRSLVLAAPEVFRTSLIIFVTIYIHGKHKMEGYYSRYDTNDHTKSNQKWY